MAKSSAGLLMYRRGSEGVEVLLAHPGGPFFRNKDEGAWTLPKGEPDGAESAFDCARREFREETGLTPPEGPYLDLGEIVQRAGKRVRAWAFEGDHAFEGPPACNTFEIEWPPRSGKRASFPEIDQLAFFALPEAQRKINPAQVEFLVRLARALLGG
jgi:predicted NUDIX family NTP pyrophosphohydrolase